MNKTESIDSVQHSLFKPKTKAKADGNASFLRAARSGNLDKVLEFLKGGTDINTCNANGLNALHLASKEGHVHVVTELLKRGASVDAATKKGNTALHIASLAGQEEVVKILVQNGAKVNAQSQNGFTPLYMAAQENHFKVSKFLLDNGANQSLSTEDGFTPLAVALQQGHEKVVTVLLENDSRGKVRLPALHIAAKKDDCRAAALLVQSDHHVDVQSKSGFTPLHIASHYGNVDVAKLLIQSGADVNFLARDHSVPNSPKSSENAGETGEQELVYEQGITPLHVAAKWGKLSMVRLLLEAGAAKEITTRDGLTPLHCAARSGHDQVVDVLIEGGAPMGSKTKNGLTPLHMAAQGDHVECARLLLYHQAPVDDITVDYLTPLHVAAHCGHHRVAKILLDRKAEVNARALNGFTPLHIACKKNRIKVVELLLKHGASIEATTESGLTPLHVAAFMGCMNIVIFLIQHGSDPDQQTVRGETALHLASRANQTDIVRILLRNGAQVDARAREQQTPLHIASRLGNVDIVMLLLQHGASPDAITKDNYTALHIAAKEGHEEVASVLLEHGASLGTTTKKGFTPLHVASKYGNIKVASLLLQRESSPDAQGKNGLTPLHVAAHYNHVNIALLLLDHGASPHAAAKNGYTPLHIASKKNQMEIATTLLEYGAKPNAESKTGISPLHLASQEGHVDMVSLLIDHGANVNAKAKNGLTPMHLCAQEDKVPVAAILAKTKADIDPQTKAGYTPLHTACHFGQMNMVRFLLQHGASVNSTTKRGYTPLHQAAQQGHTQIIDLLLQNQASPNVIDNNGQTPLAIAQRLGYISVVETLKVVTETTVQTTTVTTTEEKYKVVAPETMQESFMTDSEDEGDGDAMAGDASYPYLTSEDMRILPDDSLPVLEKPTGQIPDEEIIDVQQAAMANAAASDAHLSLPEQNDQWRHKADNVEINRSPIHAGVAPSSVSSSMTSIPNLFGFLVSFMVDARGGAMRGCRHSGVRLIIPPRKAQMPTRVTCRLIKKEKLSHPPPLMEGEALAARIVEMGPVMTKFLGPVVIEIPHFASLRGREREIMILRSENGETWREHVVDASEEAIQETLNGTFDGEELDHPEELASKRITRILTTDFPQYFAIVTRIRQESHSIGADGGMLSSTVVPQVQAVFPEGALTKRIKVGLQAQPIASELVSKLLGNRVAVSAIVTVEPRRRKFHKPITLTIPVPQAASKGMLNKYGGGGGGGGPGGPGPGGGGLGNAGGLSQAAAVPATQRSDAPTLRLLCSITGGTTPAQWEDITGTTPLTFVNDCVSFTTTVSARFWLMDCQDVNSAIRMATELYREAIACPFMSKFVVFAKRHSEIEARLRVFCMTDDKMDKTLESQENFVEVARSRDVEVLESKQQWVEMAGNLVPVTKSGEQLHLIFHAFRENRLPFIVRLKDMNQDPVARIAFMREAKVGRHDSSQAPQLPICNLNLQLPDYSRASDDINGPTSSISEERRAELIRKLGISPTATVQRAELRLSDIADVLQGDWVVLAYHLDLNDSDILLIKQDYPNNLSDQALAMMHLWYESAGEKATGNNLEKALKKIKREDVVQKCMYNIMTVTDTTEREAAKLQLDQSGDSLDDLLFSPPYLKTPTRVQEGTSFNFSLSPNSTSGFEAFKEELGPSRDSTLPKGARIDGSFAESAEESGSETSSVVERAKIPVENLFQDTKHGEEFQLADTEVSIEEKSEEKESTQPSEQTLQVEVVQEGKPLVDIKVSSDISLEEVSEEEASSPEKELNKLPNEKVSVEERFPEEISELPVEDPEVEKPTTGTPASDDDRTDDKKPLAEFSIDLKQDEEKSREISPEKSLGESPQVESLEIQIEKSADVKHPLLASHEDEEERDHVESTEEILSASLQAESKPTEISSPQSDATTHLTEKPTPLLELKSETIVLKSDDISEKISPDHKEVIEGDDLQAVSINVESNQAESKSTVAVSPPSELLPHLEEKTSLLQQSEHETIILKTDEIIEKVSSISAVDQDHVEVIKREDQPAELTHVESQRHSPSPTEQLESEAIMIKTDVKPAKPSPDHDDLNSEGDDESNLSGALSSEKTVVENGENFDMKDTSDAVVELQKAADQLESIPLSSEARKIGIDGDPGLNQGDLKQSSLEDEVEDALKEPKPEVVTEETTLTSSDGKIHDTRVVMKKKVHKKTTVRDGKEETIVTTDTHVEHDDKGPEDLQAAMKEIIDNFVEGTGEFSSEPQQDK